MRRPSPPRRGADADRRLTAGPLLVLDLLLAAAATAFWTVSRRAGATAVPDLGLTLLVTASVVGSAGQHAVL